MWIKSQTIQVQKKVYKKINKFWKKKKELKYLTKNGSKFK